MQPARFGETLRMPACAGLGVDVGADRLHVVGLDRDMQVCVTAVFDPFDLAPLRALLGSLAPRTPIAIDGPAGPSAAPFAGDLTVSRKFRSARGCEVELGRQRGIWVSFATGTEPLIGWMGVAATVHALAAACGLEPLEVYPHAVFRMLVGTRPPKKTSAAGIVARVDALAGAGVTEPTLALWSHDAVDAAGAVVVALHHAFGTAVPITCAADATTIWLPAGG